MPDRPLSQAVKLFLDWARSCRKPATVECYRLYLEKFSRHVGELKLRDVQTVHGLTFSSKFHPLQAVKRLFRWLFDAAKILAADPMASLKLPPLGMRQRTFSPGESARLMRRACKQFRAFLLAVRETACRPQEIRTLAWPLIRTIEGASFTGADLIEGKCLIYLNDWKTKGRTRRVRSWREIPIGPRLGRLLWRLHRGAATLAGPVFKNTRGLAWTANAVRCQMRSLRVRAGIRDDLGGERVCTYTMRHTSASAWSQRGEPLKVIAEILGHESLATTQRYLHSNRQDMLDLVKKRWRSEKRKL